MNAMLRLPSGHPDSRLMAAIQHFGLQILRGGKGGQSVPAGVGQPTLLVAGLTVGGTG